MIDEKELEQKLTNIKSHSSVTINSNYYYCFRNVPTQFANQFDVRVPIGSFTNGGRYNKDGSWGVLYLSKEPTTCMEETTRFTQQACLDYHGAVSYCAENQFPRVFVTFKVKLSDILDLTNDAILEELEIELKLLTDTDWERDSTSSAEAKTQIIGRLARKCGFEAILSPSARCDGKNLNVFCENLKAGSEVDVININNLSQFPDSSDKYQNAKLDWLKIKKGIFRPLDAKQLKSIFGLI